MQVHPVKGRWGAFGIDRTEIFSRDFRVPHEVPKIGYNFAREVPFMNISILSRRTFFGLSLLIVSSLASAQTTSQDVKPPENVTALSEELETPLAPNESKFKLTVGLSGSSKEDRYMNSKSAGAVFGVAGERTFTSYLSGRVEATFLMMTGSFSNRYGDEGKAPTFMAIDEAVVALKPYEYMTDGMSTLGVTLEAGVIPTSFSAFTSTLDANGFPGFKERLHTEGDQLKASAFAMQSMPTSGEPSVKMTESGVTTTFAAVGADIATNPKDHDGLTLKASLVRFDFRNLNESAAKDSEKKGNTIIPGAQPRFQYEFGGYEGALGGSFKFSDGTVLLVGGTLLRNEFAPETKNKAYIYSVGLGLPLRKNLLTTTLGYFYNESDSLPAAYQSSSRDFNNRFGQWVNVKYELEKEKVSTYLKYTRVNEIEDSPLRDDRDQISVGLEVEYEVL
jgi:hypothetical protein